MSNFQPHDITWTAEKSAKFWDYFSSVAAFADQYFSCHSGESVVAYAGKFFPLTGRVLDYGCGPGFLIGHLLRSGVACEGLDFSPTTIQNMRDRFGGHPLFRGATAATGLPTPLADATMDVIFCVEVVEHLLQEHLAPTFVELHRLLRRGGLLILTTPNEEDLAVSQVVCPECGCLFHRYQHVRTWSAASLRAALEAHGFLTLNCQPTTFGPKSLLAGLRELYQRITRRSVPPHPHLVYVGRRP